MKCAWCFSDTSVFTKWVELKTDGGHLLFFCHAGCLIHWLLVHEPEYFDELEEMGLVGSGTHIEIEVGN